MLNPAFHHDAENLYRYLALTDYLQTERFVKSTPGIYETNPLLRGSSLNSALVMAGEVEGLIFLSRYVPKGRKWLLLAGSVYRLVFVLQNTRLGCREPFYVPLVSVRF